MLLGTGVLWEIRPLKYFLVTNILHTATGLELHLILPLRNIFCGKCKNWESLWLLFFLAGLFYFSYHLLLWQVVDLLQYPMFVNFLVCFVMIFNVCKNCLENISKSCHYQSLNCFLVYHFYNCYYLDFTNWPQFWWSIFNEILAFLQFQGVSPSLDPRTLDFWFLRALLCNMRLAMENYHSCKTLFIKAW